MMTREELQVIEYLLGLPKTPCRKAMISKEYTIDLREAEKDRWIEVIREEGEMAKTMIHNSAKDFLAYDSATQKPSLLHRSLIKIIANGYRFSGGHFQGELKA